MKDSLAVTSDNADGQPERAHVVIRDVHYECHRSEEPLLYAVIEEHYPRFLKLIEAEGTSLPRFVTDEFLKKTQRDVARFLRDDWLLYPSALVTAEETCACYFTVFS